MSIKDSEVTLFQLFNILFKGKLIIFFSSLIFLILSTSYYYYQNQNSSYTASKKIIRHSTESHNMKSLFKITQNFFNIIEGTNIKPNFLKSFNDSKTLIKFFNDNLHDEENFKYTISNLDISDNEMNDISYKINSNDPDISGTDLIITYKNEKYFEPIISNMINYAINETQNDLKDVVDNDYSYIIDYFNELKKNRLIKQQLKTSNLNYRLEQLKYYKSIAEQLNIEYPVNQNIYNVYLDFTNEYVRGFKALQIEIDNLEQIINDKNSFKKKYDINHTLTNDNDIELRILEEKIQTLNMYKQENTKILNSFIPVNLNKKVIIVKNIDHDLLRNGLISIIIGLIFGIIIVLFQYSIKKN